MLKNILWVGRYKHPLDLDHRTFLVDLSEDEENPLDLGAIYSCTPVDDSKFVVESEHFGLPYIDDVFRPNGRLVKRIVANDRPFVATFWDVFNDFSLAIEWDGEKWHKHENNINDFDKLESLPYLDGGSIISSFMTTILTLPFNFTAVNDFNIELCHRDDTFRLNDISPQTTLVKYFNEENYKTVSGEIDFTNVDCVIDASDKKYDRLTILFDDENTSEKIIKNVFDLDNNQVHTVLALSSNHSDLVKSATVIFHDKPDVLICIVVDMEDPNNQFLFINGENVSKEVNYLI